MLAIRRHSILTMVYIQSFQSPSLLLLVSLLLLLSSLPQVDTAFISSISRAILPVLNVNTNNNSKEDKKNNIDELRESAQRLRKEAKDLEDGLSDKRTPMNLPAALVTYVTLADSTWTCTYRISSDARNDDEQDLSQYSGTVTLTLNTNGYSDLVSQTPTGASILVFDKVWGWDQERSNEDELDCVLFSTSVTLPSDDKFAPNQTMRFYWQARVETSSLGQLTLQEGTVTVKKDVQPPGGFWGAFSGAGILAQFRFVGNFNAKATQL